ncbi:MAG: aldehyde-activating protein [Caulobacter sp.]|nr:aldehyde-activating protein [Caulobacter sp.]
MKIDGACHCGEITYEARVDPARTIVCHCGDCQTISGGPCRVNVPALTENLTVTGTPTSYVKTGGSGDAVTTAFCGTCGSALWSGKGDTPAFVFLRTGVIRQRAELIPTAQGFCESGQPWAMEMAKIPVVGR